MNDTGRSSSPRPEAYGAARVSALMYLVDPRKETLLSGERPILSARNFTVAQKSVVAQNEASSK